jgi:hypothetical protein
MNYDISLKKQGLETMKSIIEEGSSLAKAVEKGWQKAGKPQEFTVKIFEEAQKNFIGMTIKSAKVGIFFKDIVEKTAETPKNNSQKPTQKRAASPSSDTHTKEIREKQQPRPIEKRESSRKSSESTLHKEKTNSLEETNSIEKKEPIVVEWTPQMIEIATNWLNGAFEALGKKNIELKITQEGSMLQFLVLEEILDTPQQEKYLFIGFSTLIIQALKKKLRKSLKGYKVSVFRLNN